MFFDHHSLTAIHNFSAVLDQSRQIEVLFLDLSKAFARFPRGWIFFLLFFSFFFFFLFNWKHREFLQYSWFSINYNGTQQSPTATHKMPNCPLIFSRISNELQDRNITYTPSICPLRTRKTHHTAIVHPRTLPKQTFKFSYFLKVIEDWNKLPGCISDVNFMEALQEYFSDFQWLTFMVVLKWL